MIRAYQLLMPSRAELTQQVAQAVLGTQITLSAQLVPDELAARRNTHEPVRNFVLQMQNIKSRQSELDVIAQDTITGDTVYISIGDETVVLKVAGQ